MLRYEEVAGEYETIKRDVLIKSSEVVVREFLC